MAEHVQQGSTAGGDLSGTYPDPTVSKIGGVAVSGTPASGKAIIATDATHASWQTPGAGTYQPLDSDLTAIAALDSSTSGAIASDGAGWIKKTYAAFKTALGLVKADVGLGNVTNDAQLKAADLDTDGTLAANSDTKIPSQKAVKTYADQLIASADAMVFKGVIDASANPNYPAADKGWTYRISVAGKIGGASGITVEIGDIIICLADGTASGNQATVGAFWSIAQTNIDGAVIGPASATDATPAVFDGTTGKLIKNISFATFKTSLSLVKGDVGLGNVDNTSDATKNSASAALTNKDLTGAGNTFPTFNQDTTGKAGAVSLAGSLAAGASQGMVLTLTSAQTQAIGDLVTIDSTGKATLAKADAIANASAVLIATAAVSGSASNTYMLLGILRLSSSPSWTKGGLIYLSTTGTTGNTLTQTAPSGANNVIQIVGIALGVDIILFNPSLVQVEHV